MDRSKLRAAQSRPKVESYGLHDNSLVLWPGEQGMTSATPAAQMASGEWQGPSQDLLLRLETILEVPGHASCYHFAIQSCCEVLCKRRRNEPELLAKIEDLYWTDARLVQARPDPFRRGEHGGFVVMQAFRRLLGIYLREGFLLEAAGMAVLCERFDQVEGAVERVAALCAAEAKSMERLSCA